MDTPNPKLDAAMESMDDDPDSAATVLLCAAEYLRQGKSMPCSLSLFLAHAIELSMSKRRSLRGPQLLLNLKLTSGHRRPVGANWEQVGELFEECIRQGMGAETANEHVAEKFSISESSVKRLRQKYKHFSDADRALETEMQQQPTNTRHVRKGKLSTSS